MSRRDQADGALDTVRDVLRGDAASSTGSTFMRGLTLGALLGAAIAGSAIWQRRSRRTRQATDAPSANDVARPDL
jgi:hypothetical protein